MDCPYRRKCQYRWRLRFSSQLSLIALWMMSFFKITFPESPFLNFCLIAFDIVFNYTHFGDLLHFKGVVRVSFFGHFRLWSSIVRKLDMTKNKNWWFWKPQTILRNNWIVKNIFVIFFWQKRAKNIQKTTIFQSLSPPSILYDS